MKTMKEALKELVVLKGYEGMNVQPEIEEKPEDIWLLIQYEDHGDEFVIVGTRDDKKYKYGCFENLKDSKWFTYIRKPKMFKSIDNHECACVSNKIFFRFERAFAESHMSFGYDKIYPTKDYAQLVFDEVLKYINELSETATAMFDYTHRKQDIEWWLERNGIKTKENLLKLENAKFHNRIGENEIVGIAGKQDVTKYDYLECDTIKSIYVNGKFLDPNKISMRRYTDEWGVESVSLSLKGFQKSKDWA